MRKNKLLLLLALLLTAVTGAWAEEQVVYTLDGTQTASNNAYATAGVVNQGGMTWMVTGNVNQNPWRIGGKSLSGVDRSIWSESSLDETVTKVTLEFGTASSITVNSITMMVAGDADFNNVIDSKPVNFSANNTVDVTPTEGKEWKNAYYLFVFNVTVSGSSNKYFQLKSIKFYNDPDAQQQGGSTEPVAGTFTVSLKEGTVDAGNWSIASGEKSAKGDAADGLTGLSEGDKVTLQYNGRLKVKGVKATSDAAPAAKPDLLSGKFSVSATKQVNFSKGNLQATYDGSNWTWAFANNQWDYIGNSAGNTKVTDASPFISENGTVDLFGWVGASSTWDGVNQYGITSSKARNVTNGYGNSATENLKKDWGAMMGTGWFTLSKDEWTYLLNTRSASNVGGTDNGRYAKAKVNDVQGIILFPDTYTHPDGVTAPTGVNATGNTGWNGNSYTVADWTKMETAGCVFLPAAGSRDGNSVSYAGTTGTYWWSTHYEGGGDAVDRAYNLYFTNNYLLPTAGSYRDMGCSVRLVQATTDAEQAKPAATVTTAPTGAAIVGVGKTTALVSGGVADGGTLMYAVTTTNTKPTSTAGFSDAVPTAKDITASGKVYVWYYVKGDDTHSDSEIAGPVSVTLAEEITWNSTNVFNSAHQYEELNKWQSDPLTYEGITISFSGERFSGFTPYGGMGESMLVCFGDDGDSFTFTAPSGKKFCKIEIINNSGFSFDEYGDWTQPEVNKAVWSGTAANAVTLGTVYAVPNNLNSIAFYLVNAE